MSKSLWIGLLVILCFNFIVAPAAASTESENKAVLVTGASSGIGRKITEHLSANGFFVYAGARKPEDLAALDELENVKSVRLDVTVPEEIDKAVQMVSEAGRGLYGLVNNAGVAVLDEATSMSEGDLQFTMDVNVYGPYRVTKAFAPLIIASQGRITTIGSISGILSGRTGVSYSMSKHAVESYTDSLAAEMEEHGVAVSVVEPGSYESRIRHKVVVNAKQTGAPDERIDALEEWRDSDYKEPDEVAAAVYDFMVSDNPRRRYMVVPNQTEAEITIRKMIEETVQLNQDQPYAYDRDELVRMLDEALASLEAGPDSD
jgi:NAD(P)-dependent dehydrogenase (short-subunit alcohol dehydrogenase family)